MQNGLISTDLKSNREGEPATPYLCDDLSLCPSSGLRQLSVERTQVIIIPWNRERNKQ